MKELDLTRSTKLLIVVDILLAAWDSGLAVWNIYLGRYVWGFMLVLVVAFMIYTTNRLIMSQHHREEVIAKYKAEIEYWLYLKAKLVVEEENEKVD